MKEPKLKESSHRGQRSEDSHAKGTLVWLNYALYLQEVKHQIRGKAAIPSCECCPGRNVPVTQEENDCWDSLATIS